jgi:hypothetical protein
MRIVLTSRGSRVWCSVVYKCLDGPPFEFAKSVVAELAWSCLRRSSK